MGCRRGLQAGEEAAPGGVRLGAKEPREGASACHARAPLCPHLAQLTDHRRQQPTTSALRAVEFSIVSAWVQERQKRRDCVYPCKCKAGWVPMGSPVRWIQFRVWIGKELAMQAHRKSCKEEAVLGPISPRCVAFCENRQQSQMQRRRGRWWPRSGVKVPVVI